MRLVWCRDHLCTRQTWAYAATCGDSSRHSPPWLSTIHPSKIAFEVRRTLELHQLEIRGVIEDYVLDRRARSAAVKTLIASAARKAKTEWGRVNATGA
jgi:hypothetical protein